MALADRVVTYAMVAQAITRLERRLRALSLPANALVCVTLDNPIRHMIVAAAATRAGMIVMSAERAADVVPLSLPVAAFLETPGADLIPGQRLAVVTDDWFAGEPEPISTRPAGGFADDQEICRVELSSGTTGRPKAISFTLAAFNQSLANYWHSVAQGDWERLLLLPGLTNNWGFSLAAHVLHAGKTLFFADTPRGTLQMIALYGIEMLVASSQQLRDLVREQTEAPIPCPSLKSIMTGGSYASQALIAEARAKLCSNIVSQYGSTEAGATAFGTVDRLTGIEGAAGYVAPWSVVEVVDENNSPVPFDTDGAFRIRAGCMGASYPADRADPSSSIRDGWFYPGDRGRLRADGLLVVTGRNSELINAGGMKLAPELIEDVMRKHPSIVEAAAFGVLGADGIEEIRVAVVTRSALDERQLIRWCAERDLRLGKVFAVEELPKTTLGKINREQLKKDLVR
jgi:acyl-coenzyme A synthetase/AMP-(fatty) acid ligase